MISWLMGALLAVAPAADAGTPQPVPPSHRPGPDSWSALDPAARTQVLEGAVSKSLPERLVEVSRRFLNTPYVFSPLGEGSGKDPDPTIRYDAVDCLTFVEETIAMSLARGPDEVEPILRELRYAREPVYEDRNHLMEAQWLPNNVRKGFVRDVTRRYGGDDTRRVLKRLTAETWTSRSSRTLDLPPERQARGEFPLQIIPLDKVLEKAPAIPSGTIMVVVREDLPGMVTRVSHLGFIIHKRGRTFMRHAAMSVYGRVVDEELDSFISRNLKYDKWRVTGMSLLEVLAPPPRSSASAEHAP